MPEINQSVNPISPSPRRLLFVITQGELGGAQRFLHSLLNRLDREKFTWTLVTGKTTGQDLLHRLGRELNFPVQTIGPLQRSLNPWRDLHAFFSLRKTIKQLAPHTLFLCSTKAGWLGALAAQTLPPALRPQVIYRIGGWTFNDPWPNWKRQLFILLERISAGWKDIIIVNNQADLEQAKRLGIKPRRTLELVANGLDVYKLNFLPPSEARARLFAQLAPAQRTKLENKTIIGTVANFYPAKGIPNYLSVIEKFKDRADLLFVIIGSGPQQKQIETSLVQLGIETLVFLPGQLAGAQTLLTAFDIFVLPSLKEGFPWALLEAMAAKLPVIATPVGAVPEIIEDGKNGFIVAPNQIAQLAERITDLAADEIKRKAIGIAAHQTVLLRYDLEKMIARTEALLL